MNTVQIIAVAVAFVSLLAAIIAGAWLNQRAIERQMEAFRHEIKAELSAINQRIGGVESKVDRIERQLDQIFKPVLPKG